MDDIFYDESELNSYDQEKLLMQRDLAKLNKE